MNDINITIETGNQILNELANERAGKLCRPYKHEHISIPSNIAEKIKHAELVNAKLKEIEHTMIENVKELLKHQNEIEIYEKNLAARYARTETVCAICGKSRILSYHEAVEDGWRLTGRGMICPDCGQEILSSLTARFPVRFEIETGPEIAKLLDGEE